VQACKAAEREKVEWRGRHHGDNVLREHVVADASYTDAD
jgi:hypothetical protein